MSRRPCRKADVLDLRVIYWPTSPARLPKEAAHLAGQIIPSYSRKQGDYGCVSVQPEGRGMWFDYSIFDCATIPGEQA